MPFVESQQGEKGSRASDHDIQALVRGDPLRSDQCGDGVRVLDQREVAQQISNDRETVDERAEPRQATDRLLNRAGPRGVADDHADLTP